LEDFAPSGKDILNVAFQYFEKVVLRVPKNFDFEELDQFGRKYVVDDEKFEDQIIFKVVYFFEPVMLS